MSKPPATRSPEGGAASTAPADAPPPSLPSRYRVVARLGSGGAADVFRVDDREARPGEPAVKALKVVRAGTSAALLASCRDEFRILASLAHPGLPRVFDVGDFDDRRPYYTAEVVEGARLGAPVDGRTPSYREVVLAVAAVCRTLGYLHRRRLIHNDVTPANIVVPPTAPESARLLDLGLATVVDAAAAPSVAVAGTPGFVAPERLGGRRWDGRADLFGVGATLYRVLGGRRPTVADEAAAILDELRAGVPPLASLRPDLPAALCALVDQLLSIDPDARPRDAAAVVVRLGEAIGQPLPLETPGTARCHALASVLVGRDAQLAAMEAVAGDVGRDGRPRLVLVQGGGGVGKSRFVREAMATLRDRGAQVVTLSAADAAPSALASAVGASELPVDEGWAAAVASAVLERAQTRTLVLAIDDAERAPEAWWRVVSVVGASAPPARVVVVLALDDARLPVAARRRLAAVELVGGLVRLDLSPLGDGAVDAMVRSLFGPDVLPSALVRAIRTHSGGVPLLVEAMVRDLVDAGVVGSGPGGWRVADDAVARLPVVAGEGAGAQVRSFFARRFAALDALASDTLRALVALGGKASAAAVAEVMASADADRGLALLEDHALVAARAGTVAVVHPALVEVVIRADGPRDAWPSLWRRAVIRLDADGAGGPALRRALRGAGQPARAFASALDEARAALGRGEPERALEAVDEALADESEVGVAAADLAAARIVRGTACWQADRPIEAERDLERAFADWGHARPLLEVVGLLNAGLQAALGALDAERIARWAARIDARVVPAPAEARARAAAARLATMSALGHGDLAAMRQAAHEALEVAEAAPGASANLAVERIHALMLVTGVDVLFDPHAARAAAEEAVRASLQLGDATLVAKTRNNLAHVLLRLGQAQAAEAVLEPAGRQARASGSIAMLSALLGNSAEAANQLGRSGEARARLAEAQALCAGNREYQSRLDALAAIHAWREGEVGAASRAARVLIQEGRPWFRDLSLMAAGTAAAVAVGDGVGARDLAARATDAVARSSPTPAVDAALARVAVALAGAAPPASVPDASAVEVAVAALEALGAVDDVPWFLRDAAAIHRRAGRSAEAARCIARARALLVERGVRHADATLGDPGPVTDDPRWLTELLSSTTLDQVGARLVRSPLRVLGVGDVRLWAVVDGEIREVGEAAATPGASAPDATTRAVADVVASGEALARDGLYLAPVRSGQLSLVVAVPDGDSLRSLGLRQVVLGLCQAALDALARQRLGPPVAVPAAVSTRDEVLSRVFAPSTHTGVAAEPPDVASRLFELTVGPAELRHAYPEIVGRSGPMSGALALLDRMADNDTPVLLTGETGTGKEVFARALAAASARADGPFVAINVAAIPATLFEAELFGHRRGAFTGAALDRAGFFEQASGGVLFLDEIGELPADVQAKLLRVLDDRKVRRLGADRDLAVDVRVVAATHRDLAAEVTAGRFRADLYYRLNVVQIRLPPLRERIADIPALCRHLLRRAGRPTQLPTSAALRVLERHEWPGNVRELENVLVRAAVLAEPGPITPRHLAREIGSATAGAARGGRVLGRQLDDVERRLVRDTLVRLAGNQAATARALGISREGLRLKMRRLGIGKRPRP